MLPWDHSDITDLPTEVLRKIMGYLGFLGLRQLSRRHDEVLGGVLGGVLRAEYLHWSVVSKMPEPLQCEVLNLDLRSSDLRTDVVMTRLAKLNLSGNNNFQLSTLKEFTKLHTVNLTGRYEKFAGERSHELISQVIRRILGDEWSPCDFNPNIMTRPSVT